MNRKVLAAAGLCVVLVLGWFQLVWTPKGNDLTAAHHRTQTAEDQAGELRVRLARLKSAQRDVPELEASRERLRAAVPDEAALAEFLLQANDAATKAGVEYLSIAPTPPKADASGEPSDIGLGISIKGGYSQLLDYLDRLYALPRVVVLDSIQVSPVGSGGGSSLSVLLGGRVFTTQVSLTPQAAPGGAATPAPGGATAPTTVPVTPAPGAATPTTGATR